MNDAEQTHLFVAELRELLAKYDIPGVAFNIKFGSTTKEIIENNAGRVFDSCDMRGMKWDMHPTHPVCPKDSFKHVQKLVKEGKISDNVAAFAVAIGAKPVDEEMEKIAAILRLEKFTNGHFVLPVSEGCYNEDFTDEIKQLATHLQAAVREAEAQMFHRIGDVLSWHIAQGNIEMKHRNLEQIMQQLNQGEK